MFHTLKEWPVTARWVRRSSTHRRLVTGLLVVILLVSVKPVHAGDDKPKAGAHEIWFHLGGMKVAHGHDAHGDCQVDNRQNWWNLLFFQPDAPWPEAMNHVQVVSVLTQVMNQISTDDLAKVAQRLNQHYIAVALSLLATDNTPRPDAPAHCGVNVEGYDSPEETARIAAKLKRAAINLRMSLWTSPCGSATITMSETLAVHRSTMWRSGSPLTWQPTRKFFPDVVIADTVPIPSLTDQPHWQDDYR